MVEDGVVFMEGGDGVFDGEGEEGKGLRGRGRERVR